MANPESSFAGSVNEFTDTIATYMQRRFLEELSKIKPINENIASRHPPMTSPVIPPISISVPLVFECDRIAEMLAKALCNPGMNGVIFIFTDIYLHGSVCRLGQCEICIGNEISIGDRCFPDKIPARVISRYSVPGSVGGPGRAWPNTSMVFA
jgi:hypothetical protein